MHQHAGHDHGLPDLSSRRGVRAILFALGITLVFMVIQLVGGWIAHSLALMADAIHLATDAVSFCIALFAFWIARRPPSSRMSYGYYRAEILGALISTLVLWIICFFLIYEAIHRLIEPPKVDGGLVFIIASVTLVMNLVTMKILHGSQKESLNARAAYLHVISDVIGNVGVLFSGGLIWLTGWNLTDPIVTLVYTVLIFISTGRIMREALEILMEGTPRHLDPKEVEQTILMLPEVKEVHDLHLWTVSSKRIAMSAHVLSKNPKILKQVHEAMIHTYGIQHMTIQIEDPDHFVSERCYDVAPVGSNQ